MAFTLPDLPYPKDALEPHIDARTMEIHHGKHHRGYVENANAALEGTPLAREADPWVVCAKIQELPRDKHTAVRNNAGGHANHSLFWTVLGKGQGGAPTGALGDAINKAFGSFDGFKEKFAAAAATRFGSGWAWLCVKNQGLEVCSTANQDNPAMQPLIGDAAECGGTPILGLDVWEHAYYLNYQNRRPDYIKAFWNVVSWPMVAERFTKAGG